MIGDTVPAGSAMRVRVEGMPAAGVVRVRANGATIVEQALGPGGVVAFAAPSQPGWARAELIAPERSDARTLACGSYPRNLPAGCTDGFASTALTSPIYLA